MFESLQPWLRNNPQNQPGFVLFQFVLCCLVDFWAFSEIVPAGRLLNGKMLSITAVKQILAFVCGTQCWAEVGFEWIFLGMRVHKAAFAAWSQKLKVSWTGQDCYQYLAFLYSTAVWVFQGISIPFQAIGAVGSRYFWSKALSKLFNYT